MAIYRRNYIKGGTYFFTVVTYKRNPIFKDEAAIELFKYSLKNVNEIHPFAIDSMVILPDHLHCIWVLPEN